MFNDQVAGFIRAETDKGTPTEAIYDSLINAGWNQRIVVQSFIYVYGGKIQLKALRLPKFEDLVREATASYSSRFRVFFLTAFIPNLIYILYKIVSEFIILRGIKENIIFIFINAILFVILVSSISFWSGASLILIISNNTITTVKKAYQESLKKLWLYGATSFLTIVITSFGYLLLIIPGLIFTIWFGLVPFVLFSENLYYLKALKRSRSLIQGYWVDVALKQSGFGLCFGALGAVIFLLIKALITYLGGINILEDIIAALLSTTLGPFGLVFLHRIYLHLRNIKYLTNPEEPQ